MKIDYSKLYPGCIIGTTNTFDIGSVAIRAVEAGINNALNPRVPSHVFAVCKEHDLFYGMSMDLKGLSQDDLNEWEHGILGDHVVFIASPIAWDDYDLQDKINAWLLKCHTIGIKYDILELFRWLGIPVYDDPNKLVCGDFTRIMLQTFNIEHPSEWDVNFLTSNPYGQQQYFKQSKKMIYEC